MTETVPPDPEFSGTDGTVSASADHGAALSLVAAEIAAEIRGHYPRGSLAVAVSGADGSASERFARELAAEFDRGGESTAVNRYSADQSGPAAPGVGGAAAVVTIWYGSGLTADAIAGRWNYSILMVDPVVRLGASPDGAAEDNRDNRDNASALVAVSGAAGPRRTFADHC